MSSKLFPEFPRKSIELKLEFFIVIFLIKYIKGIKLERRFSKYTLNSSKNKNNSLFDILNLQYLDFVSN